MIIMLKGLPASGKTTNAKQFVDTGAKRVSKDDLRNMIDLGDYTHEKELFILAARDALIIAAHDMGFDIVVDDTNLNPAHEEALKNIAAYLNTNLETINMDTPMETCIERDKQRDNPVGEDVIRDMAEKYQNPPPWDSIKVD